MKKILNKNNIFSLLAFLFCFSVAETSMLLFVNQPFYGDSGDYWQLGELLKNSDFDLTAIDGFRGYVFPLFLGIINFLGGQNLWYIVNGLFLAIFAVIVIPKLSVEGSNEISLKKMIGICVCWLMLDILFVGLVVYPLSDLFALALMCIAVLFMKKSFSASRKIVKIITAFLAGAFCYMAYNVRTIYLFAGITMLTIYIYIYIRNVNKGSPIVKRLLILGLYVVTIIAGVFAAAVPQVINNQAVLGKFSISVPTNSLMLSQMAWGFSRQRYDTYISYSTDPVHSAAQVNFLDNAGIRMLDEAGCRSGFSDWGQVIDIFLKHPIDVISMYFRHFINYLLPCFPQVYIEDLNSTKWGWGILCVTIFFTVGFVILNKCVKTPKNILYFVPIVIPGLLIVPGAVEARFSLPIYLFALCLLCFNTNWAKAKEIFMASKLKTLALYLVTGLMCFAIWSQMLASESLTPLLF